MIKTWALLLVTGVAMMSGACERNDETPTGPSPIPTPNSAINYTALGASDTIGVGTSVVCLPYQDCPNGRSYVHIATRDLRTRGFTVKLDNLGFPGAVISRRLQLLGAQYGREVIGNFMDQEVQFILPEATLVTIFAGGNDVNTITSVLGAGAGGSDRVGFITSQIAAFGQDFGTLMSSIREKAPSARIVVLNLPNMAAMPFLAGASRDHRLAAQMLSVGFTRTVFNPQTSSGAIVVDLMCDARAYQAATYSSDGFHPSDTGYGWIAAEVVAAVTSAYRAPANTCPQMTVVQ